MTPSKKAGRGFSPSLKSTTAWKMFAYGRVSLTLSGSACSIWKFRLKVVVQNITVTCLGQSIKAPPVQRVVLFFVVRAPICRYLPGKQVEAILHCLEE